ncbi:NlpC/P60 family protein [Gordonia sp. ABSL1-1]|uniref:NlpC/P60 family protein n=1 Tax=Gordonia sp. ABSL1-1 TaxID=3053923 RepID=UPI0025735845|nr:NlpC/P60 family protein [Gordonia sp. ABSL1-1]MDL9937372.1 NlpC/P60 family protein [Gordonia sp. ABSL1-1]
MMHSRSFPAIIAAGLMSVVLAVQVGISGDAGQANAIPARTADQLVADYKKLGVDAERTTEAMHNAQIEYDKQRRLVVTSRKAAADAQRQLDTTGAQLAVYQKRVDGIVRASYRGARIGGLYAVLVADSPQQLLDQMSGLDMIARQAARDLAQLKDSRKRIVAAKADAEETASTATEAVSKAERVRGDLQAKQADVQLQAIRIRAVYNSMTGRQLAALKGQKFDFDPRIVPRGTSAALIAVQAALTRIGDPYVWGATGPDQFDCSGLMVWAFKQAGRTLPRSSQAQMGSGTPVDRKDLQPGDLIIYYGGATHVGMYVGDGYVIHASTFGVPVKVVPVDEAGPYNTARRY